MVGPLHGVIGNVGVLFPGSNTGIREKKKELSGISTLLQRIAVRDSDLTVIWRHKDK